MQSHIPIRTKDGKKISLRWFAPQNSIGKVIIVGPAAGLTQDYYKLFARFFCQQGVTVITFDYRGIGDSGPADLKGYEASMHQWAVQDIDSVLLYVKNKFPNQEIIYMGHGTGGEIIGLAQASQYINKLVLINSALSCRNLWSWKDRFRIMTTKMMVKLLNRRFGYFPGRKMGLASDVPAGVMQEWAKWCNNPNGLFGLFPDSNYRKLRVPLLSYSFSDDWRCPRRAVHELLNHFVNCCISWYHIRPAEIEKRKIGYAGFFDPSMQNVLWMKLLSWIRDDDRKEKPTTITNQQS